MKQEQHIRRSEFLFSIGLLLLIPVWIGIAPIWYEWYELPNNGNKIKWFYAFLDGQWLINIPICLVFCYIAFIWCRRIWKDHDIRYFRPALIPVLLVALYCKSRVNYARIVYELDYRLFFTFLLFVLSLCMLVKVILKCIDCWRKWRKEREQGRKDVNGLKGKGDDDSKQRVVIPKPLKEFAVEIVEKLFDTHKKDQSSALGITGEWGVGKTTFLDLLRDTIGDRAEIVNFYPWMCRTPEQVINDFFSALRRELSPKYSTLSHSIKEYARNISSISFRRNTFISIGFTSSNNQDSLSEQKKNLSEQFSKLDLPVVVVIDDIDRLEREEVFEVLRLIRNTADLSNVHYLVAYDKEYVTKVLQEKEIKDASAYLEKIFPIEVHLPIIEDDLILEKLRMELSARDVFNGKFVTALLNRFRAEDIDLIVRVLGNYRRVERFADLYMLNVSYLVKQYTHELKYSDVFWIELLQIYDKPFYNALTSKWGSILYCDGNRLKIRSGIIQPSKEKDKYKYDGEPFWKEETPEILKRLFGDWIKTKTQSICYWENFSKYFTLSVSPYRLSMSELSLLFKKGADPEREVDKWIEQKKLFSSISFQLQQLSVGGMTDEQLKVYLESSLYLGLRYVKSIIVRDVRDLFWEERFPNSEQRVKAREIVLTWIVEKTKLPQVRQDLASLLNLFYSKIHYDPEKNREIEPHYLVVSNSDIEKAIEQVMAAFLLDHPEITAIDLLKEDGDLPLLFRDCCVPLKESIDGFVFKQVAFGTIIDHFSKIEPKPLLSDFKTAMDLLFSRDYYEDYQESDDPMDWGVYEDLMYSDYERRMEEYFGSDYYKDDGSLNSFKKECFKEDPKPFTKQSFNLQAFRKLLCLLKKQAPSRPPRKLLYTLKKQMPSYPPKRILSLLKQQLPSLSPRTLLNLWNTHTPSHPLKR